MAEIDSITPGLIVPTIANILVSLVLLIQAMIAIVEVFLWKRPKVHQRLGFDQRDANKVAPIVANAGLYNAFIACGLAWSLMSRANSFGIAVFFLTCVIVAGAFGAATLKSTTLWLQTLPASLALAAVWTSWPRS